ncbi:MAG: site-specific integrase [Methanoregula sp.]|jgi:integrase
MRIADFTAQYGNVHTRQAYASSIVSFLVFIFGLQKEKKVVASKLGKYEDLADRYFSGKRDHSNDLIRYAASFENKPAKTAKCYVSAVQEFMVFNNIEFREKEKRSLRNKIPRGGTATVEQDLDAAAIQVILQHCDLKLRTLIVVMASSGVRIGEALGLVLGDFIERDGLGYIEIRQNNAKRGLRRYTFCSAEACQAVTEWMKKRDGYLVSAERKGVGIGVVKSRENPHLFPFTDTTVYSGWENALKSAGLYARDPLTGRLTRPMHALRKFCSSQLSIAVPRDIVEMLMGHSGYLSDAYRRYTKAQVLEFYRKGEPYVTIAMPEGLRDFQSKYDEKITAHSEMMETIVRKNMQLETRVNDLENLIKNIERFGEMIKENAV